MILLDCIVPGAPRGAERPRAVRRGSRAGVYMTDRHQAYEARLASIIRQWRRPVPPADGPVRIEIVTWHSRPLRLQRKRHEGVPHRYVGKPDADNIAKVVMDACTKAGVWTDDTRVAELRVARWYVPHPLPEGSGPGIEILVEAL